MPDSPAAARGASGQEREVERSYFNVGQACLNGHAVTSNADGELASDYCPHCGERTITQCPDCSENIRGYYVVPGVASFSEWEPPNHCHACGKPYPWTERKAEALREAIEELDELSNAEKERLAKAIPDIIADTPKSNVAITRFKKAASKVGGLGSKMLWEMLKTVATEAVKKSMFG